MTLNAAAGVWQALDGSLDGELSATDTAMRVRAGAIRIEAASDMSQASEVRSCSACVSKPDMPNKALEWDRAAAIAGPPWLRSCEDFGWWA